MSPEDISQPFTNTETLVLNSDAEKYWQWLEWTFPNEEDLLEKHPWTGRPFWRDILNSSSEDRLSWLKLADCIQEVDAAWAVFFCNG